MKHSHKWGAIHFFWSFLKPYRWMSVGAFFFLMVSAATLLSLGMGLKHLIDQGFIQRDLHFLDLSLYFLIGASSILAGSAFSRTYITGSLGERIAADIRTKLTSHLLTFDMALMEQQKTGDLSSRIHGDVQQLLFFINTISPVIIRSLLQLAGGTALMIMTSGKLTLLAFLIVPVIVLPIRFFGKKVRTFSQAVQSSQGSLQAFTEEKFGALAEVQLFQNETYIARHFQTLVKQNWQLIRQRVFTRSLLIAVVILLVLSAISCLVWLGSREVLTGQMSGGTLSAFILYAVIVAGSLNQMAELLGDTQTVLGVFDRIIELFMLKPFIADESSGKKLQGQFENIEFKKVYFCYPARSSSPAIKDVSFSITNGQKIALVGPSGAGKTTVFQLLNRFYDPQQGKILINGHSITELSLSTVRSLFSCVPQNPSVFNATVYENIAFGNPQASREQILKAAGQAYIDEFTCTLPDGYDTVVGERGMRLSGGQRQRIAIARALLRKSPILLLDEATNALDAASEHYIQQAIENATLDKTSIIIAHRLSTICKADVILVFKDGEIIQQGTHQELSRAPGLYQEYIEKQHFGHTAA